MLILILSVVCASLSVTQSAIFPGQCSTTIPVETNFDLNKFAGRWRLISSYENSRQSGECNQANYELINANTYSVVNTHVLNQNQLSVSGTAVLASNDGSARLTVSIGTSSVSYWILGTDYDNYALAYSCQNLANNQQEVSGTATSPTGDGKLVVNIGSNAPVNYWIIGTNYDSYALAYSCQNIDSQTRRGQPVIFPGQCDPNVNVISNLDLTRFQGDWVLIQTCQNIDSQTRRVWSWKLSRTTSLDNADAQIINNLMSNVDVLDNRYFQNAEQSAAACFYYPDIPLGQPVIFPGQCDPNVNVISNLDLTRFQGDWVLIQTNLDLTRFQGDWVLIQTYFAERQSGTCNRASYTLNGNILNVENSHVVNQRRLSVSGTATSPSGDGKLVVNIGSNTLAINNLMSNIDVLDNRYFQNTEQSEAACFYNPDIPLGQPVILPGQCDPNINVVNSLNLDQFQGQWVLIQTYYAERQSGTCNRARYTLNGNVLNVENSHVVNQNRLSVSGTATSPTGDGKLVVNIGSNPPVNYWILGTNYNSYALAYSCENLDSQRRRVWSWKLSRTTSLSEEDNQAITNLMREVDVLDQGYFQNADQSDAACFFYPEFQATEPVIFPGQCDVNIPVVSNFDVSRFQNEWVLISSYYTARQSGSCNRARYTLDGSVLNVVNSHVVNEALLSVSGTARVVSNGKLVVNIGNNPAADYWILDTDYENFALAYSCENINSEQRRIWSWKLSRTTSLTAESNQRIESVMSNINVLDNRYFQNADQSDAACFYLPDIPLGEAVIFPGQCDPNIATVSNFNMSDFLGDWRLISTYYTHRQSGTCNKASYSYDGDTIRVVNSHVVNSNQMSVSGTAIEASSDGSGKLLVSISRRTVDYWILATDYHDYALAYSCSNMENNQRRVYSWKLSRSRTLSATGTTAINNVMNNVNVLNERYFERADQTDAGCFYFPPVNENAPVIFPNQCDMSVRAQYNFNVSAFLGVWHEVEIYPTGMANEQCATQEYTQQSATSFTLTSRFVNNGVQGSFPWLLERSASDTTGSFIATIQTPTMSISFPFWILSTDYDNYALAYACANMDENSRRIYSWKLGRTKQLSTASNTAITSSMANVQVLDQRYFKTTNQSEEACFHLPDLAEGQTVVLPGQCDVNIPVVANFDVAKYSGTWYQIQRYPQRFESGDCTGARYTLNGNVVTLLNWQRIDGVLDTIEGNATIISADGSAKLRVTLPSRAPNASPDDVNISELYVLTTDYETYSLVYSCVNVDAYHRAIGAWKLSRTRSMPPAGTTAIDAYMANRQELENRYFVSVQHSDECPEPSSAMLYKSSFTILFVLFLALLNLS
ncbi:unnamed protein product [Colias eurytheme]|nr:unnamed protein product [Colias eurytheme]